METYKARLKKLEAAAGNNCQCKDFNPSRYYIEQKPAGVRFDELEVKPWHCPVCHKPFQAQPGRDYYADAILEVRQGR